MTICDVCGTAGPCTTAEAIIDPDLHGTGRPELKEWDVCAACRAFAIPDALLRGMKELRKEKQESIEVAPYLSTPVDPNAKYVEMSVQEMLDRQEEEDWKAIRAQACLNPAPISVATSVTAKLTD